MKTMADDLVLNKENIGDGIWSIAKPLSYFTIDRFKEAWHVLIGRAVAIYFRQTEVKLYNKRLNK